MTKPPCSERRQRLAGALFLGAFAALLAFASAQAAEPSSGAAYRLAKGTNEFGLWIGGSPDSFGNIEDRQMLLVALRYGRVLAEWGWGALQYTVDLLPAAVVFEPSEVRSGSSTIYGFGFAPLGLKLTVGQRSWIKPFLAASLGLVYFRRDVPVPDSSRFNFTEEIGLGVDFFLAPKRALTVGYKIQHLSNAGIGDRNPGMNSHIIYAGFSFFTP